MVASISGGQERARERNVIMHSSEMRTMPAPSQPELLRPRDPSVDAHDREGHRFFPEACRRPYRRDLRIISTTLVSMPDITRMV